MNIPTVVCRYYWNYFIYVRYKNQFYLTANNTEKRHQFTEVFILFYNTL